MPGNVNAGVVSATKLLENGVGMFGVGQSWQDVTALREFGVTYTNTTGKGFELMVSATVNTTGAFINIGVNGQIAGRSDGAYTAGALISASAFVPSGATYSFSLSAGSVSTKLISECR